MRWVAVALSLGVVFGTPWIIFYRQIYDNYDFALRVGIIYTFANILPFTVVYAALRHRVIDVAFVLNRAVVFALLAGIGIALFASLDWFMSRNAVASRLELAAYVAIALALGFSFGSLRGRLIEFVDAALFRRRYRSRRRLDELADRVYGISSRGAMGMLLTQDLPAAIESTSAALFERLDDGGYLRGASSGWTDDAAWHIFPDQAIAQRARTAARPIGVETHEWYDGDALPEAQRPALAVPITVAHTTQALLLLGPHRNGADFDAAEVGLLKSLAARVSSVYAALPVDSRLAGALPA